MRPVALIMAILVSATIAVAAPVTITVSVRGADGELAPVPGARVALVAADEVIHAEQVVTLSPHATDADGQVSIERPAGRAVAVAGIAFRGFAFTWLSVHDDHADLILPPEAVLIGFVVDLQGTPIPGAEVLAVPERPSDTGDFLRPGSIVFREYTEGDGSFRFRRLSPQHRYRIRASAPGLARAVVRDQVIRAEPVLLKLGRGAVVRGLVLLIPGGKGVSGCEVELSGVTARTNERGEFELKGVPPGSGRLLVRAAGRTYENEEELVLKEGGLREGIVVRVVSLGRIKGRVLTPATTPATGARIFLRYPRSPAGEQRLPPDRIIPAGRTDEDGRFDLTDLLPAQGVDLIVVHPDYAPTVHLGYSIVAGRSFSTVVLLRPGGAVTGRVLDAKGLQPFEGAKVFVLDHREDPTGIISGERSLPPTIRQGLSGSDGEFTVENIDSGRKTLLILAEGRLPTVMENVEIAPGLTRRGILIFLGAGAQVTGRIVTSKGNPVPAALVSLVPEVGPAIVLETTADGTFVAQGIPAGTYRLHVTADGFVSPAAVEVNAPTEDVEVVLRRGEGLPGQVVLEGTEEPVGGAVIRALRLTEASPLAPDRRRFTAEARLRADPETGRFKFTDLPPGEYRLEAWTEDGRFGITDALIVAANREAESVLIRVDTGWALVGRVLSVRSALPIEGALVAVRGPADEPGPHVAVTDAAGQFRIEGVPAGFHSLIVTARGHAPTVVNSVEVRRALVTRVEDVLLRGGARVSGVVRANDGSARSGLALRLISADLGGTQDALTDEHGAFVFEHVTQGQWLLELHDPLTEQGGRRIERLLLVPERGELQVLIGSGAGATITGLITASGVPQAHARLQALRLSGAIARERTLVTTTANAEGKYLLRDLEPGDYFFLVRPAGSLLPPARFRVNLRPGPITLRDLVLPDSGVQANVEDLETGDPIAGVRVILSREAPGAAGTFLEALCGEVGETVSDAAGRALFPAVEPGSYRLVAFGTGYGQGIATGIRVTLGGLTAVRLSLPAAGMVSGQVLDSAGRPVGSARITFFDATGLPATSPEALPVNSEGRFTVNSLRTGRYRLMVTASGYASAEVLDIEVFPGGSPEIEVRIDREGRILVTVYGPGGQVLPGARIFAQDFWGRTVTFERPRTGLLAPFADPALAGEQGTVLLTGLAPGIYTVSATLSGYRGTPARIRVLDGELSRGAVVLLPIKEDR